MPTTLTLTTWNVQNLFRPVLAESTAGPIYDAKIRYLAQTIIRLAPDVIALQEVGSDKALADLQGALKAAGAEYPHRQVGTPDRRGIACAFLSKSPLSNITHIERFPPAVANLAISDPDVLPPADPRLIRMGRGALCVSITKSGFSCDLIALHLKSKLLSFGGNKFSTSDETLRAQVAAFALARRTAEAATVRIFASHLIAGNKGRALAVLGDFNDGPSSATTQIFQGPGGSELETGAFDLPDQGDAARLWNLASLIRADRRFSRIHRGQPELLDQILVSEEFLPRGRDGRRRLPVKVDSLVDGIRSIGDDPNAASADQAPDHAPVTAAFDLG